MGIYDRDYYRKEGPSFLDYFTSSGKVCKWLVVTNIFIFLIQVLTAKPWGHAAMLEGESLYGPFTDALAMKPDRVFQHFEFWRLLTGAFLHSPDNWMHLVWNMLALWWFGPDLEDLYGHREFLAFYLVAGVVGNFLWGVTTLWQLQPGVMPEIVEQVIYPIALGASGAVTACVALCALHFPTRTVLLFFVLPVPLWLCALIFIGGDLFYFLRGANLGVAVAAHLGGAIFALFYFKLGWRFTSAWASFVHLMRRTRQPRLKVYRETPAIPVRAATASDEQLEAKADAVLEKVARDGMASLSPEERDILQRASERYKKRRT